MIQFTASSNSSEPAKLLLTEDLMVADEKPVVEQGVTNSLQAKIARLETLIAEADLQFEPEAAGDGALAGARYDDAPAWHGEIEDILSDAGNVHPLFEKTEQAAENTASEQTSDVSEIPENDLSDDEDQELRAFISAMIREELRGSLGQDISDRLRQMVREEIQRALADMK
jgi:hypothetical protein